MKSTIAIINTFPKFDAVFAPVAGEIGMAVKNYPGIRPLVDDLNDKALPFEELALIIVTGTTQERDAAQFRRNLNLLEQLANHSRFKSVPVLFLGHRGDKYLSAVCTYRGAEYLDLPVRRSELLGRIRELCEAGAGEAITISEMAGETGSEPVKNEQPVTDIQEYSKIQESEPVKNRQYAPDIQENTESQGSEPPPEKNTRASVRKRGNASVPSHGMKHVNQTIEPESPAIAAEIDELTQEITVVKVTGERASKPKKKKATETAEIKSKKKTAKPAKKKVTTTTAKKARKSGSGPTRKGAVESERRLATVMFADIAGFTAMSEKMDPEEVTSIMNSVFHELEEVISKHGGTIDKFIGDCVMVLFGVPRALENAPLMAVNTAIDMKNALYRFNKEKDLTIPLDIHIGVNSGPVIAGIVGGKARQDFTVMGDAVNLASRIEGISEKGQILVGPDTFRATKDYCEFRALSPVSLKGKAEPVPVYEVLSVKEAAARRRDVGERTKAGPERMIFSEMVGRDEEMNELRFQVMKLIKGKGGIVNVIGEAGIGKSRLMAELKSDPVLKQATLLEGQAVSMGRNLSFHPIIDLLKNWAGIREDDGENESFNKLDKAIRTIHPAEADEIVPFVGTLMGMKLSGKYAERVKGIEGESLEKLIFKNTRELLIKGSELRPMIVRIEDLHWADTSSIELLSSLFRLAQTHRILFLNFFRPNYEETGDRIVKNVKTDFAENYSEINIQPLDENESVTLISNLLNIKGLPQSLKDQITERAGGNPFFIEEVLRALIDEGVVVKKGDSFNVNDTINSVTVPLTINEVLMSRIDRLDEETKNLIKTASVIGRYFFHKIITQVAQNISDIDQRLGYLEDIQLIRERKRMDELEYLFKHALAQEAAYESLLIQKRKELHLYVAQSIENVFSHRLHEFYGMLAYHYSMGDNPDKTEEYLIKAGEEAMKTSASSEALEYFVRTLELYRDKFGDRADPGKIALIEKNIAMAHYNRGDYVEAVDYFTRVLKYHGEKFPKNQIMVAIKFIHGLCHLLIRIYLPTLRWKKTPSETDLEIISLYEKRGISLAHPDPRKFFIETFYMVQYIVPMNISANDYLLMLLPNWSAIFSWPSISYSISKRILMYSNILIGATRGLPYAVMVWMNILHEFMVGNWVSTGYDEESARIFLDKGDIYRLETYGIMVGFWYLETGNVTLAFHMADVLSKVGETFDHIQTKAFKIILDLRIMIKIRRLPDVLEDFDKSIALFDRIGDRILHFEAHTFKARTLLLMGDVPGSRECLDYLEKLNHEMDLIPFYKSDFCIAHFMFDMHQLEDAINSGDKLRVKEYRKKAKQSGAEALKISRKFKRDRTEALKLTGTYFWLLGKPKKAIGWWKKSIDMGEMLGAKLELSRTYFEVGKRLYLPSPSGIAKGIGGEVLKRLIGLYPGECLDKAEAMFREMKLQWDLAELSNVRQNYSLQK